MRIIKTSDIESDIPAVTSEQMREVDRLMIQEYGVELMQMMEHAGRNLAELVRRFLKGSVEDRLIVVAVGKGNNGGGGLVVARHLHNWGARVTVLLPPQKLKDMTLKQMNLLKKLVIDLKCGAEALEYLNKKKICIVIDALIGYSLSGPPRGWQGEMIKAINNLKIPVVSLDIPSGLDSTTGEIYNPCVRATLTMTLALPKKGLLVNGAEKVTGKIYLADIGVPGELYKKMGFSVGPLFAEETIISLEDIAEELA
jgi:NAD(P)H-hydrate epimerase